VKSVFCLRPEIVKLEFGFGRLSLGLENV